MHNWIYLESLHTRRKERFSENDICDCWEGDIPHNALVSTLRMNHSGPKEENLAGKASKPTRRVKKNKKSRNTA